MSLLALFGASGTYHVGHWPPVVKARLQRLDHAMIFVLIAGSYTPVTLLALEPTWGVTFLVLAWDDRRRRRDPRGLAHRASIHRFAAYIYIGFGWLLVLALPAVLQALTTTELALLAAGGVLYTVGRDRALAAAGPNPSPTVFGYHEVWHAMTLVAAGCHYVLVLLLVAARFGRAADPATPPASSRRSRRSRSGGSSTTSAQSYRHRFGRVVIAALLVFGVTAVVGTAIDRSS